MKKHLLILAIGFLPNIGGLETHLKDLIEELVKKEWEIKVVTYQPLNTPVLGKWIEKSKNVTILRLPVIRGLFYNFLKVPALEFLFLGPLLFLATPVVLVIYPQIQVVNAQGLIAGVAAAFWAKLFRKRYVVSVQSVYSFPQKGLYSLVCKWIFKSADKIIAISTQAKQEIIGLGINAKMIQLYTNWENSNILKPQDKKQSKRKIGFANKFLVSFFGRLIEEKGIKVFIEAIKISNKRITFAVYGEGPFIDYVKQATKQYKNIHYMGIISPEMLSLHYSAADIVIMPTLNEEGFGRVAAGALLCGTPVIASNKGALPEVVNNSVGRVIEPTVGEIAKAVNFYFTNKKALKELALHTRSYALSKFSERNAQDIIKTFKT